MTFPLYQTGAFDYATAMALATVLGVAFGFVLERAGFGDARNLAAQFTLRDMRVLKVMFTAIATATAGMGLLAGLGAVDIAAMQIPETFLGPHLLGGLLLGVGFVVSGYCPGTAVVGIGSGHTDAAVALLGVAVGGLGFGLAWPVFEGLYSSGSMGVWTLVDVTGLPWSVLATAIVLVALGAFAGGEAMERWIAGRSGRQAPASPALPKRLVGGGLVALSALGLATLALPAVDTEAPAVQARALSPLELGTQIAGGDLWLVDLRSEADCAKQRIPGALCTPGGDAAFVATLPPTRPLVLYGAGELQELPPAAAAFEGPVFALTGGMAAFERELLQPVAAPAVGADLSKHNLQAALHAKFTGTELPPPVVAKPRAVKRKARKGGGC